MITITGLSPRQVELANLIWACETNQQVQALVDVFGSDAEVVRNMIVATVLDSVDDIDISRDVLNQIFNS